jgi:2-desacetyl-2-hydroxyethyl bacteriochlorophyllide A dehydrogenase
MRALVYEDGLHVKEVARPEPAAGEVIGRVLACGICGTDLRIAKGAHRAYPEGTCRVPGHELVIEISDLGAGVDGGLAEGDRVFVAPNLGCGRCPACRAGRLNLCRDAEAFGITFDGGFAEYVRVPAAAVEQGNLLPVPAGADPAALSVVEPLACVLRGQRAVAVGEGDRVLVCGAGPIGLLHVALARAAGATVLVSEPHAVRRTEAVEFGAAVGIDPAAEDLRERVLAETDGLGADVVITAVPVPAVQEQALGLAAIGGRINFFGGLPRDASTIRIDSNDVHYRELQITGTTANDTDDCRAALELATSGRIDLSRLVTARFSIDQSDDAFAAAAGGRELKVVIEP